MDSAIHIFDYLKSGIVHQTLFSVMFLLFGYQLYRKKEVGPTYGKRLFISYLSILAVSLTLVYAVYDAIWRLPSCGPLCRYFLPPYSHYYFNEVVVRWMSTFAFNASVGLVGGLLFAVFARMTKGSIIDQLDVDLLTVGGMVAGWPNILIFYAIVFIAAVVMTIIRAVHERSASVRMIVTPVLPLAAACVALFGDRIAHVLRLYEIGATLV